MNKTKPKATVTSLPKPEPTPKQPAPAAMLDQIEQQWRSRAKAQGLPGPQSITYQKAEAEYFVGAMATLDVCGYAPPMRWIMAIMSDRSIAA